MSIEFIERIPLFASLSPDELRDILLLARPVSFRSGQFVFEQGVEADGMYVLEGGCVQLWARLLGEEEMALARIGAGGVLGEFSLIDRGARSATAEVVESTSGYFFSNRHFELLRTDARPAALKTMHQLGRIVCERLRAAFGRLGTEVESPAFHARCPSASTHEAETAQVHPTPATTLDPTRLRVMPFFSAFPTDELSALLSTFKISTVPRGQALFRQGDAAGSAYVTVRGAVELVAGPEGAQRRVAIHGPGKLFGLVAPLDGGERPVGCVVRESAIVLELPREEIESLHHADTPTRIKLLDAANQALIEAVRSANATLLCQTALGRLGRLKKRSAVAPLM